MIEFPSELNRTMGLMTEPIQRNEKKNDQKNQKQTLCNRLLNQRFKKIDFLLNKNILRKILK